MSWFKRSSLFRLVCVGALTLSVSACFRPLYGSSVGGGSPVAQELAAIDVKQTQDRLGQERIGHYLRQEMIFELEGGGKSAEKRYSLELNLKQRIQTAIVDTVTGRADSAMLISEVNYVLRAYGSDTPIINEKAEATASYDRNPQRFASIRAARDAEIKLSKQLAEQIRNRLAAYFATRTK
jgi:LPS-assembly lipoprotein